MSKEKSVYERLTEVERANTIKRIKNTRNKKAKANWLSDEDRMFIGGFYYIEALPRNLTLQNTADIFGCSVFLMSKCIKMYEESFESEIMSNLRKNKLIK